MLALVKVEVPNEGSRTFIGEFKDTVEAVMWANEEWFPCKIEVSTYYEGMLRMPHELCTF